MPTSELGVCGAMEALVRVTGPVAGLQVVDIGSGEGALARQLAEAGAEVTGVDPLGPAAAWTGAGAGRYRLLRQGAEAMPFADGAVDLAIFIFSLHHVPPTVLPAVLQEVARVLKPGGRLYVAEPVAAGPVQEVTALYHDETAVRAEAAAILEAEPGLFHDKQRMDYYNRRTYAGFDEYAANMVRNMRFNGFTEDQVRAAPVRQRFEAVAARLGGVFDQPVHIDVMTR